MKEGVFCCPQRVNVFTSPLGTEYCVDDFEKMIKLFPLGRDASKISDYNGFRSEF